MKQSERDIFRLSKKIWENSFYPVPISNTFYLTDEKISEEIAIVGTILVRDMAEKLNIKL